jgi:phosphoglycerate dehydrogenase-like enzyme
MIPDPPRRVLIVDRLRDELASALRRERPDLELRSRDRGDVGPDDLAWADAYVGFGPPAAGLDGIAWVHAIGAGIDSFIFRRPFPAGTLLTRATEPFGGRIAEYCLSHALAGTQRHRDLAEASHHRRWEPLLPASLADARVLVLGTGEVGQGIARAFIALGGRVTGVSRSGAARTPFHQVLSVGGLAEGVAASGWFILAAPLTEATYHLVGERVLAAGKGAHLMNVGRGGVVEEAALLDALDRGAIRHATLDVFETEPLPPESPFWTHPKVTVTPHISGPTTVEGAVEGFLAALSALERGEAPASIVDRTRGY